MQCRSLACTGLQVSWLYLGTMNFGPQTSETDSFAIMDHAWSKRLTSSKLPTPMPGRTCNERLS